MALPCIEIGCGGTKLTLACMCAQDMTDTIELALTASGCEQAVVRHKLRLLSDDGSCYISGDLAEWLEGQKMKHVRGAPFHPQTQSKIARWHQTMKNRVLLTNYYLHGDLERQIGTFWSAPVEWSGLNVSAWSVSGLSGRSFRIIDHGLYACRRAPESSFTVKQEKKGAAQTTKPPCEQDGLITC
jgi:transposase InsO family protein